ncbi:hypothetical protein [Flexibacter flexilis]|nr:hypothetical protein [Flexibacter flexilis]
MENLIVKKDFIVVSYADNRTAFVIPSVHGTITDEKLIQYCHFFYGRFFEDVSIELIPAACRTLTDIKITTPDKVIILGWTYVSGIKDSLQNT